MMRIHFRMEESAYLDNRNGADWDEIEAAVIKKIEGLMEAVRKGRIDLEECVDLDVPLNVSPVCPHCGRPLRASGLPQYAYQCDDCDEDFFAIECEDLVE